ncbi:MAG: uracil-DNA glycosylase [Anaerolineae bacterium]
MLVRPAVMSQASTSSLPQSLDALWSIMRACRRCQEAGFPAQGPAVFAGSAHARVMVIGQAPAAADRRAGSIPWSGSAGQRLRSWLAQAGWTTAQLDELFYFTALTRCYPGRQAGGHGDRPPTAQEIALCAPYLQQELDLLRPRLIILVGRMALAYFIGAGSLSDHVGRAYRAGEISRRPAYYRVPEDAWLVPLPHPSGASVWPNQPANRMKVEKAIAELRALRASDVWIADIKGKSK